jgi:iron complex outermembrane receptor protein
MDYGSLEALFGEPVTTNATGTPQRASEVAANMTIITADQIRQSGNRSIPEIIGQYVTGVDVLRTSLGDYDVGVRGHQMVFQSRLLVLVDGRQVFIDDYSRTVWNNLPVNIDDVRQIEVVKGPASALFGSNAASGVVNIITYSPVSDKNNVAAVSLGTQNSLTGDATVTKNGTWGGTKFSAGGLSADEFKTGHAANDSSIIYSPERRFASNSSVFNLTPDLTANMEVTASESKQNVALSAFNSVGAEDTATYSARGGFNWQTDYGMITSDTYFNHAYDTIYSSISTTIPFGLTTDLVVSSLNDQFKVGSDHTFRTGLEYRHKDFRLTAYQIAPGSPAYHEDNYAASGTWLWQIANNLSLTNAVRFDHLDMNMTGQIPTVTMFSDSDYSHAINTWSANSALAYKMTDLDTFRLSYGRGVQMPSLLQSGSNFHTLNGATPVSLEGSGDLKPTITQSYEVAYDRKIAPIYSTAKLATFYVMSQDVASFVNNGMQNVNGSVVDLIKAENIGESQSYGGEIALTGNHNGFRWDASYSLAKVIDSASVLANQDYQGSSPEHHFRFGLGYTYKDWEFDANSQVMSSTKILRDATGAGAIPIPVSEYMTVGARVGYNLMDNLNVAVSGTNLNRHTIGTSPYPAVERQAFVTLTGKF